MTEKRKKKALAEGKCKNCGKSFTVFRKWAEFCGPLCRVEFWQKNNPRISSAELERLRNASQGH